MTESESDAVYAALIPTPVFAEYEWTEQECVEAQWKRIVEKGAAEIKARRQHLASTHKGNALEDEYYQSRYDTLKSQLKRELRNDPTQYFVDIYKEFTLWHDAGRPTDSPVVHAVKFFENLDLSARSIWHWLSFRKGQIPKERTERFRHLYRLALFLTECGNEMMEAVDDEDSMASVKRDYNRGVLKFMGGELQEKYAAVFGQ
ncbi:hypothetical protein V5O48_014651 [Marasmius crinis-equi]|uniref:Uncharacterized protein n=1 Tax=Marasmius crinis-equi TaxID=585013 RepID=A0ABR3EWS2_9AGAR